MRILHFVATLNAGGAETALARLCTSLGSDFSCTVVTLIDAGIIRERLTRGGIRVETLGIRGRVPGPGALRHLRQLTVALQPDVIHGWMPHGNLVAMAASMARAGTPVVWGIRQALYDLGYERTLTRALIRAGAVLSGRTARCIYNSTVAAEHHESLGYRRDRRAVIPNGFDTGQFAPNARAGAAARRELGIPEPAPIVLMLARAHPVKDHPTLLRAAAQVIAAAPETVFVLAGAGTERGSAVDRLAQSLGVSASIRLLGERQDTAQLAASADIGVLSSYTESFPNAVGELMASGVPCVTTAVGDAPALVGQSGRVVAPRDPGALAAALLDVIRMPAPVRAALGMRARRRIEEHYSLRAMAEAHAAIYRGVLGR